MLLMCNRVLAATAVVCMCFAAVTPRSAAQAAAVVQERTADVSVTYVAMRSLKAQSSENFWMQGGSFEVGGPVWRTVDLAANLTGAHASSIGSSGVPLSLVTATVGPRFRWDVHQRWSMYGEGLFGIADGFNSVFPGGAESPTSSRATGFAMQLGGGLDYKVRGRFSLRVLDAAYVRTQLPNGTDDVQNTLRLGAGVVMRFNTR